MVRLPFIPVFRYRVNDSTDRAARNKRIFLERASMYLRALVGVLQEDHGYTCLYFAVDPVGRGSAGRVTAFLYSDEHGFGVRLWVVIGRTNMSRMVDGVYLRMRGAVMRCGRSQRVSFEYLSDLRAFAVTKPYLFLSRQIRDTLFRSTRPINHLFFHPYDRRVRRLAVRA